MTTLCKPVPRARIAMAASEDEINSKQPLILIKAQRKLITLRAYHGNHDESQNLHDGASQAYREILSRRDGAFTKMSEFKVPRYEIESLT